MAVIDSAYQYYLCTYGTSSASRYDAHKKSQLRDTYNQMMKVNKESPLYKIKNSGEAKKCAIDIKESVKNIQHVAASLSDSEGGISNIFSKKVAQSSDESTVTAEYLGEDGVTDLSPFSIEVRQLAAGQVNCGNYLAPDKLDFSAGAYMFDLNTNTNSYQFQFTVNKTDTNASVLHKISDLINRSKISVTADILADENGREALRLCSKQTGTADGEENLFQVFPSADTSSIRAIKTLGIDKIEKNAQNAVFLINGEEYSSYSNHFTVNNRFHLTLHGVNESGSKTDISFKANADAVADNVRRLVDSYNKVIQVGHLYANTQASHKLVSDISNVAKDYRNELEAMGLSLNEESYLQVDDNLLTDAALSDDAAENFSVLGQFKDALNNRASNVSVNPMNYVNKILVAYKNPGRAFATPYITSIYSGMMLDRYC